MKRCIFCLLLISMESQKLSSGIFWRINGFVAKERHFKSKYNNEEKNSKPWYNLDNESSFSPSRPQPHKTQWSLLALTSLCGLCLVKCVALIQARGKKNALIPHVRWSLCSSQKKPWFTNKVWHLEQKGITCFWQIGLLEVDYPGRWKQRTLAGKWRSREPSSAAEVTVDIDSLVCF